jgi:hypothetical protein
MIRQSKAGKATVELAQAKAPVRGSRIRRDPVPVKAKAEPRDVTERETWTVVIGVLLFAIAITIIIFGASDYTAH